MAKKQLTVTQIKMFENMIAADFKELMGRVGDYRRAIQESARIAVGKESGLYELKLAEKKLELQLSEVKEKIANITGPRYSRNPSFEAAIERKVKELLAKIGDGSLVDIEATYEHFLRKVRLAGVTDDVRDLFENDLPKKIQELSNTVKQLPSPKIVRSEDETLLLED